jgi:hypothetical protein
MPRHRLTELLGGPPEGDARQLSESATGQHNSPKRDRLGKNQLRVKKSIAILFSRLRQLIEARYRYFP